MAQRVILATNNRKKLAEMTRLFEGKGYEVVSMGEVGVDKLPPENGETFAENAKIKAVAAARVSGEIAVGDDSGLCVDALNGAPGIFSARFAGEPTDDDANNEKLVKMLSRVPYAKRGAKMVCSLVVAAPNGDCVEVSGECEGMIGFSIDGDNGFGYDPLFYVNQRSFAALEDEEKDMISHRSKAVAELLKILPDFFAKHNNSGQDGQ